MKFDVFTEYQWGFVQNIRFKRGELCLIKHHLELLEYHRATEKIKNHYELQIDLLFQKEKRK